MSFSSFLKCKYFKICFLMNSYNVLWKYKLKYYKLSQKYTKFYFEFCTINILNSFVIFINKFLFKNELCQLYFLLLFCFYLFIIVKNILHFINQIFFSVANKQEILYIMYKMFCYSAVFVLNLCCLMEVAFESDRKGHPFLNCSCVKYINIICLFINFHLKF